MARSPQDLLSFERALLKRGNVVVGLDEVGRGALAGPLTVGAVVVASDEPCPRGLTDSKLLSPTRRDALEDPLRSWCADWALGSVDAHEIDRWGLHTALSVAATRALDGLTVTPTHALIDGTFNFLCGPRASAEGDESPPRFSYDALPVTTLVRGDQRSAAIAAASVLAKVHRDRLMVALSSNYEEYGWSRNKGYGAPEHLEALRRQGPSEHHRVSWRLPRHEGDKSPHFRG